MKYKYEKYSIKELEIIQKFLNGIIQDYKSEKKRIIKNNSILEISNASTLKILTSLNKKIFVAILNIKFFKENK